MFKLFLSISATFYIFSSPVLAGKGEETSAPQSIALTRPAPVAKMPRQIQPALPYQDFEAQGSVRYPKDFRVLDPLYANAVRSLRQAHARYKGQEHTVLFGFHHPNLLPLAKEMETFLVSYAKANPNHTFTQRLIRSLQSHMQDQDISPYFLWALPFQFAASISNITSAEKALFTHAPYSNTFFSPLKKEGWKHNSSMFLALGNAEETNVRTVLPHSVSKKIHHKMTQLLPVSLNLPFPGEGQFGPAFLVRSYLRNLFPAGLPLNPSEVHGFNLSSYGFGIHDLIHGKADPRYRKLISHVIKRGEAYVKQGGNIQEFVRRYPQIAIQRYGALMGALNQIYENLGTKVLFYRGLRDYRKAMVGFFWLMHEKPHFPSKIYDMNDLSAILKAITSSARVEVEDLSDPLNTSPFTGESTMVDAEIIDWVLQNKRMNEAEPTTIVKAPRKGDGMPIDKNRVVSAKVKRDPYFIDVRIALRTGETLDYFFQTLHYKWNEMDDSVKLLRFGSTKIEKPDLTTVSDPRAAALETLWQVKTAIADHVRHFREVALFFVNYDPQGDGSSLGERYFRWHFNQEQELQKILPLYAH